MKKIRIKKSHREQADEIIDLVLTPQFQMFIGMIYGNHPNKKRRDRDFQTVCNNIQTALEKNVTTNGVRAQALMTMLLTVLAVTDPNLVNGIKKMKKFVDGDICLKCQRDDSDIMVG